MLFGCFPQTIDAQAEHLVRVPGKLGESPRNRLRMQCTANPYARVEQVDHRSAFHVAGGGSSMSSGSGTELGVHPSKTFFLPGDFGVSSANGRPRFTISIVSPRSSHLERRLKL